MLDVHLFYLCVTAGHPRHQLGRDHRAMRAQFHPVELLALEQFESAVDIANRDAEQDTDECRPRLAVDTSHQMVGAMRPASAYHVILGNPRRQALEICGIELAIAVA